MRFQHILLRDFQHFDRFETEFSNGLNVVKGPNEAGKSTLNNAILLGLFDRPTGKQSESNYKTWGEDDFYMIELTCVADDEEVVTIRKDYSTKSHEIITAQGSDASREALERATKETLGVRSRRLFESTACVCQGSIAEIDSGRREISEQLQQIVTGSGDVSVDRSIEKLEQKLVDLGRGWKTLAPRNPGPIKQLQDRISEVEQSVDQIREEVNRRKRAGESYQENNERLEKIDDGLRMRKQLLENYLAKQKLIDEFKQVEKIEGELEERIEKIFTAEQSKKGYEEGLDRLKVFEDLDQDMYKELRKTQEKVQTNLVQLKKQEELIDEFESRTGEAPEKPKQTWVFPIITIILGVFSLVIGVIMSIILNPPTNNMLGIILFMFGGISLLAGFFWLLYVLLRKKPKVQAQLDLAKRQKGAYQEDLETNKRALQKSLADYDCENWSEFEDNFERYLSLISDLKSADATLDGALGSDETLETLIERRKGASRSRRDIIEKAEELKGIPELSAEEYQKLILNNTKMGEEKIELESVILRLEGQIEVGQWTVEDLHQMEERLASLDRQKQNAIERYEVYSIALDVMQESREHTMSTAKDELGPKMSVYLDQLTHGRFSDIVVDENLNPLIIHDSKPDKPISPDELSKGTRDQLYFAARLALCDLIFPGKSLPLLMDDPFVTFDPNRRDAALELCKELAKDRQIILFTCHEGYDEYADRVIALENPQSCLTG